jgi:hypothetical protein
VIYGLVHICKSQKGLKKACKAFFGDTNGGIPRLLVDGARINVFQMPRTKSHLDSHVLVTLNIKPKKSNLFYGHSIACYYC